MMMEQFSRKEILVNGIEQAMRKEHKEDVIEVLLTIFGIDLEASKFIEETESKADIERIIINYFKE